MLDLAELRVCFVAGNLQQGGAERQLFYMLQALQQSGTDLRVLCLTQGDFWEERFQEQGVPITWVGQSKSKLVRLARIIAELRKHPADVLQSQHFYANFYVAAAARALGLREVGAMRSNGMSEIQANGRVSGRLNLRTPRLIAANSRTAIRNASALGVAAARFHFLPNIVDTKQFEPATRHQESPVRLLAVGRLTKEKRFDRFLSVLARLRQQSSIEARGVIVGSGRQTQDRRPELERQAAELGLLPDGVEFMGAVTEMAPIYRAADVLVLTSDYEGTPNVVLEAMASGLPVVATRVGDVPEIVRHGETGYLTDATDEASMTEALLQLVGDRSLRMEMGCRARKYVEAERSLNRLPKLLADLYRVALS